jgi:pyruvate kinase
MTWNNRTKIVATLGPASNTDAMVGHLIQAGVDVFRINCAHMDRAGITQTVQRVRRIGKRLDAAVGILADLQGPKIRTGPMRDGEPVYLQRGATVRIDTRPGVIGALGADGLATVGTGYRQLAADVRSGERILLDDGNLELRVLRVAGDVIEARVVYGGMLAQHKGINLPGSKVTADCLSPKDIEDLACVLGNEVDYVALSFVRSARDVVALRERIDQVGADIEVIAKIERPEAVQDVKAILDVSDGLMVARGDMGVEIGAEAVPPTQKRIIRLANEARKPVITATQMLESMVLNPRPTRAEASDVANAIYDGTTAVMLSAETASGKHPVRSVRVMEKIIRMAERDAYADMGTRRRRQINLPVSVALATARAAGYAAYESRAKLLVVYTETGATARLLAAERPPTHVLAFTPSLRTLQKLALVWGIRPVKIAPARTANELTMKGDRVLRRDGWIRDGDRIVQITGTVCQAGIANTMTIREM